MESSAGFMKPVKKTETSDLVIRMMNNFVAHDYLEEGVWEFLKCVQSNLAVSPSGMEHFVLVAEMDEQIIGTIEMRESSHITLFCVEKKYRRRGIGRKLLQRALEVCKKYNPELSEVSVNSLHGSVHIYRKLGFHVDKPLTGEWDLPCTPMSLVITKEKKFHAVSSNEYETKAFPGWFMPRIKEKQTYILYDG
jgi:GNAT superfamily N-acetyltransferase